MNSCRRTIFFRINEERINVDILTDRGSPSSRTSRMKLVGFSKAPDGRNQGTRCQLGGTRSSRLTYAIPFACTEYWLVSLNKYTALLSCGIVLKRKSMLHKSRSQIHIDLKCPYMSLATNNFPGCRHSEVCKAAKARRCVAINNELTNKTRA